MRKMVLLPTHAAAAPAEDPQERRRRSPFLAGGLAMAGLCLGAAAFSSYEYVTGHYSTGHSSERRLEVREEGQDVPEYDLPPVDLGAVVEAEVDIPGPNSAEPAIGDRVSLIAQQLSIMCRGHP